MKFGLTLSGLMLGGSAVVVGSWLSQPVATAVPGDDGSGGTASVGPDVIVGAIPNVSKYGTATFQGTSFSAYAFGSTSCNIGTVQLDWFQGTNQHPVIPQNMYRLKNGRFEMIGMSWVKHGFCALQQNLCGTCTPAGGGCPSLLGIGCSDPYDSGLNGSQNNLGPRSLINAATGAFPFPYSSPPNNGVPNALYKRVMVKFDDLVPANNSGAIYFAECQYIHPDDAAAGNDDNNASYRRFTVGSLSAGSYNLTLTGATAQQKAGIFAWKEIDPLVEIKVVDAVNDGRFHIGYRVTDNGDGTWHYEFAVANLNSDRSGGSFSIPMPEGVNVTNIGFSAPMYHSGEPYSNAAWTSSIADGMLTWTTESFATNANANAIRWATLYNFRFDADIAPTAGTGTLGLFKPAGADPNSVTFPTLVPSTPEPTPCPGDLTLDGMVDAADLSALLAAWGTDVGDLTGDSSTDAADLSVLLSAWGACP